MASHKPAFDLELEYNDHPIRILGTITPGCPATGPTYSCGGTPAEPPCIEDYRVFLVRGKKLREIDDRDNKILFALEDDIFESMAGWDDHED